MKLDIDYRAAFLLKEAATETKYFATLGKQTAGTALLGLSFFSQLLNKSEDVICAFIDFQKQHVILTSADFLFHVYSHGTYLLAHLVTCVTALFWQAHRMHNYLETEKLDISIPLSIEFLQMQLIESQIKLKNSFTENAFLRKLLSNPELRMLLDLKMYFSKNLQGRPPKLIEGITNLMNKIFKAVEENQSISPFTNNAVIVLAAAFCQIPVSEERDKYSTFLNELRKKWSTSLKN